MEYIKLKVTSDVVDLQGVLLRDGIRKKIKKIEGTENISGSVANIPEGIEIICKSSLKDNLKGLVLDVIRANQLIEPDLKEEKNYKFEFFEDIFEKKFELERSGELQETVWALQGAGKVFQQIGEQIEKRDLRKCLGLLSGVKKELYFNNIMVTKVHDLSTNAIEKFLVEIPIEDPTLIGALQIYLLECKAAKSGADKKARREILKTDLDTRLDNHILDIKTKLAGKTAKEETNKNLSGDGDNNGDG